MTGAFKYLSKYANKNNKLINFQILLKKSIVRSGFNDFEHIKHVHRGHKNSKNIFLVFTKIYENTKPSKQNVKRGELINVNP